MTLRKRLAQELEGISFTPCELRIIQLLADGERHRIDDVVAIFKDPEYTRDNVKDHVVNIRTKLDAVHHTIACIAVGRRLYYQYMILLKSLMPS
jgi:hypothetical protein